MINSDQNSTYFNLDKIPTNIAHTSTSKSFNKCLFLDTFYNQFLINLYSSEPHLINESYLRQLQKIINTNNGDSDFYSSGLKNAGWQAEQIVINSPYMQAAFNFRASN
jgi:hypothetical protein